MKKSNLSTVAKAGMVQAFYTGVQEGYGDAIIEIEEMKKAFNENDKEMIILKSLEKSLVLSSKKQRENEKREMSKYRIVATKHSVLKKIIHVFFRNKKADNTTRSDQTNEVLPASND